MIRLTKAAPKAIPNREWKWNYLVGHYGWSCPIANAAGKKANVDCLHHAKVHNTEYHRRRHPLLVHSILNTRPANNGYHVNNGSWGKIWDIEAHRIEAFLERHSRIAAWVNGERARLWD